MLLNSVNSIYIGQLIFNIHIILFDIKKQVYKQRKTVQARRQLAELSGQALCTQRGRSPYVVVVKIGHFFYDVIRISLFFKFRAYSHLLDLCLAHRLPPGTLTGEWRKPGQGFT